MGKSSIFKLCTAKYKIYNNISTYKIYNKIYNIYIHILYYPVVLIAQNFTHCSQSIPEAVITAVPAADDRCQHPKHVELPTEM